GAWWLSGGGDRRPRHRARTSGAPGGEAPVPARTAAVGSRPARRAARPLAVRRVRRAAEALYGHSRWLSRSPGTGRSHRPSGPSGRPVVARGAEVSVYRLLPPQPATEPHRGGPGLRGLGPPAWRAAAPGRY